MSHLKKTSVVGDKMPETIVKIVGSKYVRCLVDTSKRSSDVGPQNFISHLKETLSKIPNADSFRGSLLRRDRTLCGLLSISEFHSVCESHGLSFSPSSLLPLLDDDVFADQGKIRWRKIVDLLHRREHVEPLPQKDEATEDPPVSSKEPESPASPQHSEISRSPTSENVPQARPVAPPWSSRPISEPAFHLFEGRSSEERGAWIDRFKKLENALWLCQIKDTGLVEADRARQILHRYNVVYRLSLSDEKMAEALEKFDTGGHVTLGPALLFLKEL